MQSRSGIFNVIAIMFLLLSCGWLAFVALRMTAPPPARVAEVIIIPTVAALPSITASFTPSNTVPPSLTSAPTETITATYTGTFVPSPTPFPSLTPRPATVTPTYTETSAANLNAPTLVATIAPSNTANVPPTAIAAQPSATNDVPTNTSAPTITLTPSLTITATLSRTPIVTVAPSETVIVSITQEDLGPTLSPFPFAAREVIPTQNFANALGCNWQGIGGQVFDTSNQPLINIRVHVFGAGIDQYVVSGSNTLYGQSGWEVPLGSAVNTSSYFVELQSAQGTIISPQVPVQFVGSCAQNLALVNFIQTRPF